MKITNPETLREAAPDLTGGIPASLWTGSDPRTREWLITDYRRQLAHATEQRETANAIRHAELQRLLGRPTSAITDPPAQLRRVQALLLEAAAVVGRLASTIPAHDDANTDADASCSKEATP